MLIAGAGQGASTRFLEFFNANIRNPNTRAANSRAAGEFLRWCEERRIGGRDSMSPAGLAAGDNQAVFQTASRF